MNVLVAGAAGRLGRELVRAAIDAGHGVVAVDRAPFGPAPSGAEERGFRSLVADALDPGALAGLCEGMDAVVSAVGLTTRSATLTHYDVDLGANRNLLAEAARAGARKFVFISVLKADSAPDVPMLDAKKRFEDELKASGLPWLVIRPTGYFYDIARVFTPMVERGRVTLLAGPARRANVVDTADLGRFVIDSLGRTGETIEVGGRETRTYEEIAALFFAAAGKPARISRVPAWLFGALAFVGKLKRDGSEAAIRFGRWTMEHDMVAENAIGAASFADYVAGLYAASPHAAGPRTAGMRASSAGGAE